MKFTQATLALGLLLTAAAGPSHAASNLLVNGRIGLDNVALTAVPEPQSCALLMAGLLATGLKLRRRAQAR